MTDSDDRRTAPKYRSTAEKDRATASKGTVKATKPAIPLAPERPSPTKEVNAIGDYFGLKGQRSFWAKRSDREKFEASLPREERRKAGKDMSREWYPDTKDFRKIEEAGRHPRDMTLTVATTSDLLLAIGKIGATQPGTVSRLNIFTHGSDDGQIVLEGEVSSNNVLWTGDDLQQGSFGDDLFENVRNGLITFRQKGSKKEFSIADVRSAFSKNAVVALYACHSGLDAAYLRKMSGLFGIPVKGFKQEIVFKLDPVKGGGLVSRIGLRGMPGQEVLDFHALDPFVISSN